MKNDLSDVTFLILVRLDSIERLENTLVVTESIMKHFQTNVHVLEAAPYDSGLLRRLIHKKVRYEYVEDRDNILHKTMYYNRMAREVKTPYFAIWDTDIIIDKKATIEAVSQLRDEKDVVFPYDGTCYEVPEIIKRMYFGRQDIRTLYRNRGKMNLLYEKVLFGGALFIKTDKYIEAGGDNEKIYGWGNDDFVRHKICQIMDYKIYRTPNPLFHLSHPRGKNSSYSSYFASRISASEYTRLKNSSIEDITGKEKKYE